MPSEILWQALGGWIILLILAGLLALVAALLPRLGERWEQGATSAPLSLTEMDLSPGPVIKTPLSTSGPSEPLPAPLSSSRADDLVAAAIACALAMYQQEETQNRLTLTHKGPANLWVVSGRWQAMQARLRIYRR